LKCQYHGWQYDDTGNVCRIPDARSFRPLEPGTLGLTKYRAELCGDLIFVCLSDDAPSLRDFLGSAFETYEQWFTPEMHTIICTRTIDANWKVLVENALESYHTTEVHPSTFGRSPDEQDCLHELHPDRTSLTVSYEQERSFRNRLDRFAHWMVGRRPSYRYQHILHYPHLMFARLSLYQWIECILPVSPTRSISLVRLRCHIGRRGSVRRLWNRYLIPRWANKFLMRVGAEDFAVLPYVQSGLQAADRPLGGLISTREERVFHFQRYIQASTPSEADRNGRTVFLEPRTMRGIET
jgi:phenylpropionate dioxygenase-like ring-hydroxylating dioxygenase large terminal subunit